MKLLSRLPLFLITSLLLSLAVHAQSSPTYTPIDIGTNGAPSGYWEFLPGAYHDNPSQDYALVIFFHGLGGGGNGSSELSKIQSTGPMGIINNSGHALHNIFDDEDVIVLAPQAPSANTWWNTGHLRAFLDYVLANYPVDTARIYFTGLSAGSSGLHDFIDKDPDAQQITAAIPVATRGSINSALGIANGTGIQYWALTAIGDASNTAVDSANNIADGLLGSNAPNLLSNYPNSDITRTGIYNTATGWTWTDGVDAAVGDHPKITLYPGGNHNSWDVTYNNPDVWTWLFAQVKPSVSILTPTEGELVVEGQAVTLSCTAADANSQAITGGQLQWSSDLDGFLGTGASLQLSNLSVGVHTLSCRAVDGSNRARIAKVQLTVLYGEAFTTLVDFGTSAEVTAGNWNNITDHTAGSALPSLIDDAGANTGVRLEIQSRFAGAPNNSTLLASDLYPVTAQRDTMYVDNNFPTAEVVLSGLNPAQTYDFIFFASRETSAYRGTVYTIGASSQLLDAGNNTNQSVTIADVSPDASGQVLITIERDSGVTFGYLGVLEISTAGSGGGGDSDDLPDSWEQTHFGNLDQDESGDFDGDGLSNLLEYALGSSPAALSDAHQPSTAIETVSTEDYLALDYVRDTGATGLTYTVERSVDLLNWSSVELVEVSVTPVSGEPGLETVRVRSTVARTVGAPEYLRLRVATNP